MCISNQKSKGIESLALGGHSINLGLGVDTAYPDWRNKFTSSNLPIQRMYYGVFRMRTYLLPFGVVSQFNVFGIGKGVLEEGCTLEGVLESI